MPRDDHKFQNGTIVDDNTVRGYVEGNLLNIEVLDGGLPKNTTRVTVRDTRTPSGEIVMGAFVQGREGPVTVIGKG
jgi:hypothetical protein